MSSLHFAVQRLIRSGELQDVTVWPIAAGDTKPGVIVNRTSESVENRLTQGVLIMSCQSVEAMEADAIGERVIKALTGCVDFECDGVSDIEFQRGPVDVTSLDMQRGVFLREIEYVISW